MESISWPTPDWDGHLLFLHRSERDRRAAVAAWARRGLELGERVVYIGPEHDADEAALLPELAQNQGADAVTAHGHQQLQVLAADPELYTPAGQEHLVDRALADGFPAVRISATAATAATVVTEEAHADLEWAMDQLCHTRPVSALCQYHHDLAPMTLHALSGMHSGGVLDAQLRIRSTGAGVCLAGEADVSNQSVLRYALQAALHRDRAEHTVELGRLDFVDVGSARALMTATHSYRHDGGVLRLRGAKRAVRRVLELMAVDRLPGVVLEGT